MSDKKLTTIEKTVALNFDPTKYGTIVEIGAGQEVSRWFFQAGGAAGSIAKTMSAYDMDVSNEIYGMQSDNRYVSRSRLERMLSREFDLNISRLEGKRSENHNSFLSPIPSPHKGLKSEMSATVGLASSCNFHLRLHPIILSCTCACSTIFLEINKKPSGSSVLI